MSRVRAADDFEAIRLRLEELHRERARSFSGEPPKRAPREEPDAVAHVPRPARTPVPSTTRRPGSV